MLSGLTLAMVVGLPLVARAGSAVGWCAVFAIIALLGAAVILALRRALPHLPISGGTDAAAELRVLGRRDVLLALVLTTVGFGGMFTVFTYITPLLREATSASAGLVAVMLALFGAGATIGNAAGGRLADRSVTRTLAVLLGLMLVVLIALVGLMRWPAPSAVLIFLWAIASFAAAPPLQKRVMAAAADAPTVSSAMNIGAFNLGNVLGAAFGGAVLSAGGGYPGVALARAVMAAAALGLLLVAIRRPFWKGTRKTRSRGEPD